MTVGAGGPPAEHGTSVANPKMSESFDTRDFRKALGLFPTGVSVITCRTEDGEPFGITANSFSSVSLDPPLILWSIDRAARSAPAFEAAKAFAVSVLEAQQTELAIRFAQGGLHKFAGITLPDGLDGVPLIPGAVAHFECTTHALVNGGDHLIILGHVRSFMTFPGTPMVFAHGRFVELSDRADA